MRLETKWEWQVFEKLGFFEGCYIGTALAGARRIRNTLKCFPSPARVLPRCKESFQELKGHSPLIHKLKGLILA